MLLQIIFLFIAIILGIILLISIVAKEKFKSFLIIIALSFVILIIYALRLEEGKIAEHKIYIKSLGYSIIEQKNYNEFMIYDKKTPTSKFPCSRQRERMWGMNCPSF